MRNELGNDFGTLNVNKSAGPLRHKSAVRRLLKKSAPRRVGARDLQDFPENRRICRPGALTGRVFQQYVSVGKEQPYPMPSIKTGS